MSLVAIMKENLVTMWTAIIIVAVAALAMVTTGETTIAHVVDTRLIAIIRHKVWRGTKCLSVFKILCKLFFIYTKHEKN